MMENNYTYYFEKEITWLKTSDAEFPFKTKVNNVVWQIRINDFPEEALYTLIINDKPVYHFDDWPSKWTR